jgi:hypothetical protein
MNLTGVCLAPNPVSSKLHKLSFTSRIYVQSMSSVILSVRGCQSDVGLVGSPEHMLKPYVHTSPPCSYEAGNIVPEGQQIQNQCDCVSKSFSVLVTEVPFEACVVLVTTSHVFVIVGNMKRLFIFWPLFVLSGLISILFNVVIIATVFLSLQLMTDTGQLHCTIISPFFHFVFLLS